VFIFLSDSDQNVKNQSSSFSSTELSAENKLIKLKKRVYGYIGIFQ